METDDFRHAAHGRKRNVLELDGGDGGLRAEVAEGLGIIERLVDDLIRNLHGGSLKPARPDHRAHAHAPRRESQHTPELPAADHADDLLPVQRKKYGS